MTEKETMSFARNDIMRATEAALKAYDRGVEDGARQERERIREALLSDEALDVATSEAARRFPEHYRNSTIPMMEIHVRTVIEAALDHIGLGAVTTEESEK